MPPCGSCSPSSTRFSGTVAHGSPLDTQDSRFRPSGAVVLGYVSGPGNLPELATLAPVLAKLLARYERRLSLRFWGVRPPEALARHPDVRWSDYSRIAYAEFVSHLLGQACDLAIAPLRPNAFNECKSPLKFLEYAALGVPAVYSPVGPYAAVVRNERNGLLAETPEEWEVQLGRLIESPALRTRLAEAAQETVRREWLLSGNAYRWAEVYGEILARSAAPPPVPAPHGQLLQRVVEQALVWQRETAVSDAMVASVTSSMTWSIVSRLARAGRAVFPPGRRRTFAIERALSSLRRGRRAPVTEPERVPIHGDTGKSRPPST